MYCNHGNLFAMISAAAMPGVPMMGGGVHAANSQQMFMDNMKNMLLTLTMVKGTTQSPSSADNNMWSMMWSILIISSIDLIMNGIRYLISELQTMVRQYMHTQSQQVVPKLIADLASAGGGAVAAAPAVVQSTIVIKLEEHGRVPVADAIIDTLAHLPHAPSIILVQGIYRFNTVEPIQVSPDVYARLSSSATSVVAETNPPSAAPPTSAVGGATETASTDAAAVHKLGTSPMNMEYIHLYSYSLSMDKLREEVERMKQHYQAKLQNRLGTRLFYFTEKKWPGLVTPKTMTSVNNGAAGSGHGGARDSRDSAHMIVPMSLTFSMKPFVTNRSFSNLFGRSHELIRRRVEFFMHNHKWYDDKGIPYTLGIAMSGIHGTGKTSLIKCLANEMQRHIVNIHLTNHMTITQLENLFFDDVLTVHSPTNQRSDYIIPIDRRIFVLEDIDSQSDIVLDRALLERHTPSEAEKLCAENAQLHRQLTAMLDGMNRVPADAVSPPGAPLPMPPINAAPAAPIHTKKNGLFSDPAEDTDRITLSALLNIMDGVLETPGRVVIMSTNFIQKLDRALIRPGRIDVLVNFTYADAYQIIAMMEHRYDTKLSDAQRAAIQALNNIQLSPAEVSRIMFEHFDDMEGALRAILDAPSMDSSEVANAIEIEHECGEL